MASLATNYLGIDISNPLIVGSSGLTNSVAKIQKLQEYGAGAVVLKSLFEEQIRKEAGSMLKNSNYPEAEDYIMNYVRNNSVDQYYKLIESAKEAVDIPVIASINCMSSKEWINYADGIQKAGADAIELNVYILPDSVHENGVSYEQIYFDILTEVTQRVTIPVSVKLGQHFSNIPSFINKLYSRGAKGVVLFNRFYAPDINIDDLSFTSSEVFSNPSDIRYSLRWVGIVSSLVEKIDICSSTGVHDGKAVVKLLLAGARAVQVCSVLYKNGPEYLKRIIEELEEWMDKLNFENIKEFRGRMSYKNISDPTIFERSQFMRYFSNLQ
ncbi:MAG: dihydroorotate dehydrogenase-like protein [Bacteroidales bacterium]|nr:dihydroorotate dehydrogenase-like protein [Bacteroidales bacterium]